MPFPFIPIALTAGSALAGLFNRRAAQPAQSTNQFQRQAAQAFSTTGSQIPVFDPETLGLRNLLIQAFQSGVVNPQSIASAATANQIQALNQSSALLDRLVQQRLATRGLGSSPVGASISANLANDRISQIIQTLAQQPMLEEQLRQQILSNAGQFLSSLPVGRQTTESGTQAEQLTGLESGTQLPVNQSILGSLFGGAMPMLAALYGSGAFNRSGSVANSSSITPFAQPGRINPNNFQWLFGNPFRR